MATDTTTTDRRVSFSVLDAMDAPYAGRILRLRLQSGDAPSIKTLGSAELLATGPEGQSVPLQVKGFPVFGGKPTDDRLVRTGRVDVQVAEEGDEGPVGLGWTIRFR